MIYDSYYKTSFRIKTAERKNDKQTYMASLQIYYLTGEAYIVLWEMG